MRLRYAVMAAALAAPQAMVQLPPELRTSERR